MKLQTLTTLIITLTLSTISVAKQSAGLNEIITLLPDNIQMEAKLDTGAATSSLDAENIEFFTKEGQEWVRFQIDRTLTTKTYNLEYPIERHVRIVARAPAEAKATAHHKRPVIKMDICIGSEEKLIEVNLTNRENFKYPFLVGASALAEFGLVVDASTAHHLSKECTVKKEIATDAL